MSSTLGFDPSTFNFNNLDFDLPMDGYGMAPFTFSNDMTGFTTPFLPQ
jgi:hypothetical protein